jgi:hypothetical protein
LHSDYPETALFYAFKSWDRRLLRLQNQQVGLWFVRGGDLRTVYVFICTVSGRVSYVGHNPAPSATGLNQDQPVLIKTRRGVGSRLAH